MRKLIPLLFEWKKTLFLIAFLVFSICFALFYKRYYYSPDYHLEKLYIEIEENEISKLQLFRDKALDVGVLNRSPNDYVKTNIIYRNQPIKGKLRLKGDWIDHLNEKKWSFRIKLKQSMNDGLKTFSITNPPSRGYLMGYLYHKLLRNEGILSPEYRFVEVYINNVSWGSYVLEEHLTSRMISTQSNSNGVLLKFEDSEFFKAHKENPTNPPVGLIKKAKIRVYGNAQKKKENDSNIKLAQQIIENYKFQVDTLYNSFSPEKMGMYYALCDLTGAYHAMGWINTRFYFNFDTKKMEPVGYDGFPKMDWGKPYLGYNAQNNDYDPFDPKMIVLSALHDDSIKKEYEKTLLKVTDSAYIVQFMAEEKAFIEFIETELNKNYSEYSFNRNILFENAKAIRDTLD